MIGRRGCISLIRRQFGHQSNPSPIGFIGLGHMGSKMVARLAEDGKFLMVYDKNPESCQKIVDERVRASSIEEICGSCNVIISMLPNDKIVQDVSHQILKNTSGKQVIHVSCSTVSPTTSRALESTFKENGSTFVASPVFARPDGIARREATWMMSGNPEGKKVASELLQSLGKVVDFGDDVGSANIVKLCGNFLIASTIESIGEAMALSEKHGVDRMKVMDLLSSTIFNCLIYKVLFLFFLFFLQYIFIIFCITLKGYGQRVSTRDHRPGIRLR